MLVPQSPRTKRPSQAAYCAAGGDRAPGLALGGDLLRGSGGTDQHQGGVAGREPDQEEHQGHDPDNDRKAGDGATDQGGKHGLNVRR